MGFKLLLSLAAAGLALAKPINLHGPEGMEGMNMGGMSMGGSGNKTVAAIDKPIPYTEVVDSLPTAGEVTDAKFSYNNLNVPMTDMKSGYFEKNLNPQKPWTTNGKVKTIKYGPYNVPGMGMLDGKWQFNVESPCTGCYVTAMQADLQDSSGASINVDKGAWLHHMVLYNGMGFTPFSKQDLVCSGTLLSAFMGWPHRIFASGNERAPIRLNTRYKYGMAIDTYDKLHILYDLVNLAPKAKDLYISMTYEYVPNTDMEYTLYKPAQMLWLDITDCGTSEAPPREGSYEIKSTGWTSTLDGVLLATIGHEHDGGTYTTLYINDKPVCRNDQIYGGNKAYREDVGVPNLNTEDAVMMDGKPMNMHPMTTAEMNDANMVNDPRTPEDPRLEHITAVSSCVNFGVLKKGDIVTIGATYNTTAHSMNRNMEPDSSSVLDYFFPGATKQYGGIMGISPVYVADGLTELK